MQYYNVENMPTIEQLQNRIEKIEKRNQRVEIDKAWETSWTRKIIVSFLTYFVVVCFFYFANLPKPLINALIPAGAFILSTFSVTLIKRIWMRKNK